MLAVLLLAGCASMRSHVSTLPASVTWGAVPVFPGAKVAGLQGNPAQPDSFGYRVWFPAAYKVAAHFHPAVENVTVLSGALDDDKDRNPRARCRAHRHHICEPGGRPERR
jgi:hypothetical protein